jgi:quercetin dioxygenase-like cupin family protein
MSGKRIIVILSVLALALVSIETAFATVGTNQVVLLGRSTYGRGLDVKHNHVVVQKTFGSADFATIQITWAPGTSSGWHHHPGVVLVSVVSGSVRVYHSDCEFTTYSAGDAFVEASDQAHLVRNDGSVEAMAYATFIVPTRTAPTGLRIDDPQPAGCAVT